MAWFPPGNALWVKRGRPLDQQIAAPALPPGLPTQLLTGLAPPVDRRAFGIT